MKLCISLATRGRPAQVVQTIKRSIVNWRHPNTIMVVSTDEDDPETAKAIGEANFPKVYVSVKPREDTIAEKWNRVLPLNGSDIFSGDLYSVAADDDPYITPGYDVLLLNAAERFPDGLGMVYGHLANLSFTGSLSMTAKLAEKLGYIQPAYFPYWFCDHWTDDLVRIMGRISVADIRTDQSNVGKTQEMREPAWWATFFDACYLMRRREAHAIIRSPDFYGPEWHKQLLLTHHPLIEERSRMINQNVRQSSAQLEGWSGLKNTDPRYQRVKQKALAMVPELLADPEMPEHERAFFASILTPPTAIPSMKRAFA